MKHYEHEYFDDDGNLIFERYDVHDCPFCGSKNTDLYQVQVQCERCGAHGPYVSEKLWPMAITLWNELPRKQGEELKKLRSHWSSLLRRVKRVEKKANLERQLERDLQRSISERQLHEDKKWVADREAWLRRPVEGIGSEAAETGKDDA